MDADDTVCYSNMRSGIRAAEGGVIHLRGEKTHVGRNQHSGLYSSGAGSKISIHLPQSLKIVHNNGSSARESHRAAAGAAAANKGEQKVDATSSDILREDAGEVLYEAP